MSGFAAGVDALFRNPALGVDAIYRAGGAGDPVLARVIRRAPDRLVNFTEGRFVAETVILDVRVSQVPELARGDTLEIAGVVYEVRSEPVRDSERLIWSADAREISGG